MQGGQYDLDEPVELEATFVNAPSTVVCTVLAPDGTVSTPTVSYANAPTYRAVLIADQDGTWSYRFVGTGSYSGVEEGYFTVIPSAVLGGVPNYTYDMATPLGQLRLLTDDRDLSRVGNNVPLEQRSAIWNDAELGYFLTTGYGDPYLAAARALRTLANNRNLLVQSRRIGNTTVDYGNVRADLLKQADAYQAIGESSDAAASGVAEVAYDAFSARKIAANAILRNDG